MSDTLPQFPNSNANESAVFPMVGPVDAVRSFFRFFFRPGGRATRAEYWWPALFLGVAAVAVNVVALLMSAVVENVFPLLVVFLLLLALWPGQVTLTIRRFHDAGQSTRAAVVAVIGLWGAAIVSVAASSAQVALLATSDAFTVTAGGAASASPLGAVALLALLTLLLSVVQIGFSIWLLVVAVTGSGPDNKFGPKRAGQRPVQAATEQ